MLKVPFITKPELMPRLEEVLEMIITYGEGRLRVDSCRHCMLDEDVLRAIYPGVEGEVWEATKKHMLSAPCGVGTVTGDDAVHDMFVLCGEETDPRKCLSHTIRWRLCRDLDHVWLPGVGKWYWRNGIHRTRTFQEAQNDMQCLNHLISC